MSNTMDTIAEDILSDKETWATSGKEEFLSFLEAIALEVEDEMKEKEGDFLDMDMSVDNYEINNFESFIPREEDAEIISFE
jgi:hypothetical protein